MNPRTAWIAGITALSCWHASHAQVETVRTPLERTHAPERIGAQFREDGNRAAEATMQGQLAQARTLLDPILAFCDGLGRDGRRVVSVANADEYDVYLAQTGDGAPVDWIDAACPGAYKTRAFIEIEQKQTDSALAFLGKAIGLAPYWAEALAERGYLLNQVGKSRQALGDYQQAQALAQRFASNAYARALVLRGIGYTFVELGDLEAAERAYLQSLEVEPGNALAQRELAYIHEQRGKQAGNAPRP